MRHTHRLAHTLAHVPQVLVSLSDSIESSDVSFHRDFEQEGFLGSGQFADVYKVGAGLPGEAPCTRL